MHTFALWQIQDEQIMLLAFLHCGLNEVKWSCLSCGLKACVYAHTVTARVPGWLRAFLITASLKTLCPCKSVPHKMSSSVVLVQEWGCSDFPQRHWMMAAVRGWRSRLPKPLVTFLTWLYQMIPTPFFIWISWNLNKNKRFSIPLLAKLLLNTQLPSSKFAFLLYDLFLQASSEVLNRAIANCSGRK